MRGIPFLLFIYALFFNFSAGALCVTAPQANLRSQPSAKSTLLWTVGKYMPFIEVRRQKSWILVKDLESKKMWIHSRLVSDDIDCAVIRVSKSSLRKGPGTEFKKTALRLGLRFMPFKKLERDGAWLHIEDDYGYDHWVYEKNIWEPLAYTRLNY